MIGWWWMLSVALAAKTQVAVVVSDDLQAYEEPLPAFLETVQAISPPIVMNLHGREAEARSVVERLRNQRPDVVLCLGAKAAYAVKQGLPSTPLVFATIMDPLRYGIEGTQVTGVTMHVSAVTYLSRFVGFFPDAERIGLLRGPGVDDARFQEIKDAATDVGITIVAVEVDGKGQLRSALQDLLEQKIDALWLPPDRDILSPEGFRSLVEETRRRHMPLLVDTVNMVEAGGLFAVVPDPGAIGRQSAELVSQIADGAAPTVLGHQDPQNLLVVLNFSTLDRAEIPFDPLLADFVDVPVR